MLSTTDEIDSAPSSAPPAQRERSVCVRMVMRGGPSRSGRGMMARCLRRRWEGGGVEGEGVRVVKMLRRSMFEKVLGFPSVYTFPLSISCRRYCDGVMV